MFLITINSCVIIKKLDNSVIKRKIKMNFEKTAIGIDIEEVKRFENKTIDNSSDFLKRIYTVKELEYCFSKKIAAQSLCARYCAKEAVVKALSDLKITDVYYSDIEILNTNKGVPQVKINKYPDIKVKVSLSHTKKYACANAIVYLH